MSDEGPVREHYANEGVAARVLTALRNVHGPEVSHPTLSRRSTTFTGGARSRPRSLPRRCSQRRAITSSTSAVASAGQRGGSPPNTGAMSPE
jgi:hypothetical protein